MLCSNEECTINHDELHKISIFSYELLKKSSLIHTKNEIDSVSYFLNVIDFLLGHFINDAFGDHPKDLVLKQTNLIIEDLKNNVLRYVSFLGENKNKSYKYLH
jgi:hypothetical protein